jgi:hypothetical protein
MEGGQGLIDFIKIDIQGMDMSALKSLGEFWLDRCQAGMLEASATNLNYLYEGDTLDLRSALNELEILGFSTYRVEPNDEGFREYNIYFFKKELDLKSHLAKLDLDNPIYNGLNLYKQIELFTNSTSWKITKPLGSLVQYLRKYV